MAFSPHGEVLQGSGFWVVVVGGAKIGAVKNHALLQDKSEESCFKNKFIGSPLYCY